MCWKRLQGPTSPEIEFQGRATPISQCPQTSRMCTFAASDSLAVGLGSIPVAPTPAPQMTVNGASRPVLSSKAMTGFHPVRAFRCASKVSGRADAPAVIGAVDHQTEILDLRLPAGRRAHVVDDRPNRVLDYAPFDVPDDPLAPVQAASAPHAGPE